jgi:hypothetical protein
MDLTPIGFLKVGVGRFFMESATLALSDEAKALDSKERQYLNAYKLSI